MATTVTGSPLGPFADAVFAVLSGDATLAQLAVTPGASVQVFQSLPRDKRIGFPYVVLTRRTLATQGQGAMQVEGGRATVWIDVWSDYNGPIEATGIQSRIHTLLQRQPLVVPGFALIGGSVECFDEKCFPDFDADMPTRSLYHGIQTCAADLEEAV